MVHVAIPLYVQEAAYDGNIGMMELAKFYMSASDAEKRKLQDAIKSKKFKEAWAMVQSKTGVKLKGKEFATEGLASKYARTTLTSKDKARVMQVVADLSDTPGYWDHAKMSFTAKGEAELIKSLKNNKKEIAYAKSLDYTDFDESVQEDVAANSVAAGGVDMNPTGKPKWDKRSKFHIDHLFRRADGTKYMKKHQQLNSSSEPQQ